MNLIGPKDHPADSSAAKGFQRIPKADLKLLCDSILTEAQEFYSDPKNLADFEKWKREVTANAQSS